MNKYGLNEGKELEKDDSVKKIEEPRYVNEEEFDITQWVDEMVDSAEPLDKEMVSALNEDDILDTISTSLAQQICSEMDVKGENVEQNPKKRFPRGLKIAGITIGVVLCVSFLLLFTSGGRNILWNMATNYAYGKMNYDEGETITYQEVEDDIVEDESVYDPSEIIDSSIDWNVKNAEEGGRMEEDIINILLLGEEAIDSGSGRGRTDVMIIATMNTKDKTVKLTSLMRDTLVQIPDNKDNKLNSAYEIGGVPLLYETIELNFDIKMNGYAMVDFEDFEDVINKIGGVRISLTAEEASYLNKTNYISKPEYRTVAEGSQILNGNQALGYCRIRYVKTGDNQFDDYGRTSRQRILLNAIFEQYKSKSLPELALLLNDVLTLVTTDIQKEDFETYLKAAVTMGLSDIDNLRIPADHTFEDGYVRKMSVLIPDLAANIEVIHNFIFGDVE